MSNPEVSVIIIVFNGERYLDASIQSVLAQTFQDFELLVVNDGSTDRTSSILESYASDPRVRIIEGEHEGIAQASNKGLAHARGEYIARLDSDDIMLPNRLERQLAFLKSRPELGGVGSYYEIIDEEGRLRGTKEIPLCTIGQLESYLASGGELIYPHPTMLYRAELAAEQGGHRPEFNSCDDVELLLRIVETGHPILIQPEYLTRFRYHSRSTSALNTRRQYHLKQVIFGNYRRRAKGDREISVDEYFAALSRQNAWARWRAASEIRSALFMRHRDMALLHGRKVRAALCLGGAAVLNMRATVGKLKRVLVPRAALSR